MWPPMREYTMAPLKPKFACFACRKMFRIDHSRFYWDKDLKRMVTDHPPVCPDCGADLEVTAVAPSLALTLAPQEAEDWGE